MSDWLSSLLDYFPGPLKRAGKEVVGRLTALWSTVTSFFARTRRALSDAARTAAGIGIAAAKHATAVYTTMRWIVTRMIPHYVYVYGGKVIRQFRKELGRATSALRSALDKSVSAAMRVVHGAVSKLTSAIASVQAALSEVRDTARRLKNLAFNLLDKPEHLAEWAAGAIAKAVAAWFVNNIRWLFDLAWRQRMRIINATLAILDDIVARII